MAAATSSLPEWPGAPRNWDYRYTWVREASFSNYVFRRIGDRSDAEVFLAWVLTDGSHRGTGDHQLADRQRTAVPLPSGGVSGRTAGRRGRLPAVQLLARGQPGRPGQARRGVSITAKALDYSVWRLQLRPGRVPAPTPTAPEPDVPVPELSAAGGSSAPASASARRWSSGLVVQSRMFPASGYVQARAASSRRSVSERALQGMPGGAVAEM